MGNSKSKWALGLSITSLVLSIACLCIVWVLHDEPLLPDFSATAVGVLGTLVTLLVAWQIYNALQVDEKIKDGINEARQELEEQNESIRSELKQERTQYLKKADEVTDRAKYIAQILEQMNLTIKEERMAIEAFNNPQRLARELSRIGVGQLNDWRRSVSGVEWNEHISMTPYFIFGDGDHAKIQSDIALYLIGKESYAETLGIVLNCGHQQDKKKAISVFTKVIQGVEALLKVGIDLTWIAAHLDQGGEKELDKCLISLDKDEFELMSTYKLTIQAKPKP